MPEFSYIAAELLHMHLKESCFPDWWTTSSVVILVTNTGRGIRLETTAQLVVFLWLIESLKNL